MIDEQVINLLDLDDVEGDVLDIMKILEPTYGLQAELNLRVESIKLSESNKSSMGSSTPSNCRLPKLELPIFKWNALEWQGFWDQ